MTPRLAGMAFLWICGGLLLSASQCTTPEPQPGQSLTWAQQHQLDLQQAQVMHDQRRQEQCRPGNNCPKF